MTAPLPRSPLAGISSPCVRLCRIHPEAGLCEGCGRSLEEITQWIGLGEERRRAIMAELPGRLARLGSGT